MNARDESTVAENPFCSRRVRPGAMPFLFVAGDGAARLIDRLDRSGWWGQIVGPHGSGKSALLATLVPEVERAGRPTLVFELHDGCRRLPFEPRHAADLDRSTVIVIDGYEQLSRLSRFRIKRFCRRRRLGLVVTAHTGVGLPELVCTGASLPLAQHIVGRLTDGYPSHISAEDVAERFSRHGPDLRELLFDLYDLYEQRRRGGSA
ncbi:MAG: hypothetical protein JXB62_02305 [Pirellulales bacterium]|nr:hypothetical protein [Pirellulales bacterium]